MMVRERFEKLRASYSPAKLVFEWIKTGVVSYREFLEILKEIDLTTKGK